MKLKKKIYPSPSSSSSSAFASGGDNLSLLKLLPAAIVSLVLVLSTEDREILAYLISRSFKTPIPTAVARDSKRKPSKKLPPTVSGAIGSGKGENARHKPPDFDCDCFDCYTSYWLRWDSSPNREIIHRVIEAFEETLTNGESKRSRKARRNADKFPIAIFEGLEIVPELFSPEKTPAPLEIESPLSQKAEDERVYEVMEMTGEFQTITEDEAAAAREAVEAAGSNQKVLARKVLPDLLGFFGSRLWNFLGPDV